MPVITDEMVDVVREAIYQPWMDADRATMRRIAKDALTTALPLIRDMVLDEVLWAIGREGASMNGKGFEAAVRIRQAIRDMKGGGE